MLVEHAQGQSKLSPANEIKKLFLRRVIIYDTNFNISLFFPTHITTVYYICLHTYGHYLFKVFIKRHVQNTRGQREENTKISNKPACVEKEESTWYRQKLQFNCLVMMLQIQTTLFKFLHMHHFLQDINPLIPELRA